MVQPNGIGELPGTLFKADRQCTSWKVTPANSGVRTVRTSPASRPMPGRADGSSTDSERPSHLMTPSEHMFVPFCKKPGRHTARAARRRMHDAVHPTDIRTHIRTLSLIHISE